MEIIRSSNPAQEAGSALATVFIRSGVRPTLFLSSGGSAFSVLEYVPSNVVGKHVTLGVLDERFSTDPAISNHAQLEATDFYRRAVAAGAQVLPAPVTQDNDVVSAAAAFDGVLREWHAAHPDGVIVTTMGIGTDGHTAGILPGDPGGDFYSSDWVVAYEVSPEVNPHTKRITTTYTFLAEQVNEAVVYAVGNEKHRYVEFLASGTCDVDRYPVCILKNMRSVQVYTDA